MDSDGGNRQVVITGAGNAVGTAIYEEYIYWAWSDEWVSGHRIERANRFTGLNRLVIYNSTGQIYNIGVNHSSKQPTGWYTEPWKCTKHTTLLVYNAK